MLEKTLESPLDCREIQLVHLKEISPGCSLQGLMLKLKLQYFGHFMQRVDSLEKTLMLGRIGSRRRRGWQRIRWLDGITDSMDMSLSKIRVCDGQGVLACCDSWGRKESDTTERLNWTELNCWSTEGYQNLPLLWHMDYSELKTIENKQTQEKLIISSWLDIENKFPFL